MNATTLGVIAGLALGFAVAFGGFLQFVVILLFGVIGLGVGRVLDGHVDISAFIGDRERNR